MLTPRTYREDGWLLYDASVPPTCPGDPETLLAWSGELPGGCRFGRDAMRGQLRVLAEVPASLASAEWERWVRAGFEAAACRLGAATAPAPEEASRGGDPSPDLAALCRETGWPFEERADGSLAADLGVQGAYLPAIVGRRGERVAAEVELVRLTGSRGPCRAAAVALLLRSNGAFRMARAVLREPGPLALLEVSLPRGAGSEEIGEALAALAVAAQRAALEARVLACDEPLARAYLERSGTYPPPRGT